jgi:phosphoenolpyruvate carboxylase
MAEAKQLQRQNINTKLQKLKESRNTRFCRSERQNITPKNIAETEHKCQIAETEEKTKYQNNYRDKTEIPNCRS